MRMDGALVSSVEEKMRGEDDDRLHGLEELAGDPLATEVVADHHQAHEGALEPVRAIGEEADDFLGRLRHHQVMPLEV